MSELQSYIYDITEAFINQYKLFNEDPEILASETYNTIKNDLKLYEIFLHTNKFRQQRYIYEYYKMSFIDWSKIPDFDILAEELDKFLNDEPTENLEEGFLSFMAKALTTPYHLTHSALSGTLLLSLPLWLTLLFRWTFPQKTYSFINKFGKVMQKIGQFLIKHGKEYQLSYSIIADNALQCYKQCKVDPDRLKEMWYMTTAYGKIENASILRTPEGVEKAKCLRECYIYIYLIDIAKLLAEQYFKCLKDAKELDKIADSGPENIVDILKHYIPDQCKTYYNHMKELLDNFDAALNYVFISDFYDDSVLEKKKARDLLIKGLINARNRVLGKQTQNFKRF